LEICSAFLAVSVHLIQHSAMDIALLDSAASNQHGVISRAQLLEIGWGGAAIDAALRGGRFAKVHHGVYRMAGTPRSNAQEIAAACLAAGPGAAASHRTAAMLLGVPLDRDDHVVEVSVARGHNPHLRGVVLHRSRDLTAEQTLVVDGLRCTTPTRLLVDLGQVVPWWKVNRTLERLLAARRVTVPQVAAALAWHSKRGRSGCGALRRTLDRRALGAESPDSALEARFAELCAQAEVPLGRFQFELTVGGRQRRIDFAYPEHRIAVEIDGYEWHSGRDQFTDDRVRDNALQLAGWRVLRFTWEQLVYRPETVVATLRAALAQPTAA
jgi:very-short-patch-repair endonuclease